MAYDKLYDPTSWVDKQAPGISAANLNKLAKAVSKMDDRIIEMEAATSEKTSIVDKQITALQEASEAHAEGLTDAVNRIEEVEKVQGTMSEDVAQITSTLDTLTRTTSPAITETAIGTSVCVKDTAADGYVDILAHGKYEQYSTTGAQLLDASGLGVGGDASQNILNDGHEITITGGTKSTYSGSVVFLNSYIDIENLRGKTLYISAESIEQNQSEVGTIQLRLTYENSDTYGQFWMDLKTLKLAVTIPTTATEVRFGLYANKTGSLLTEDNTITAKGIMISFTEDAPWEKYTGGKAAPNPDYSQEIKSVVVSEVRTHWKNFLVPFTSLTKNGIELSVDDKGYMTLNGTASATSYFTVYQKNELPIGNKYALSATDPLPSGVSFVIRNRDSSATTYQLTSTKQAVTFANDRITEKNWVAILVVEAGKTFTNARFAVQLEEGTSVTDYEPYTESVYTSSNPIELGGLNGVEDVFNAKETKRRFIEVVFDGSDDENWKASITNTDGKYRNTTSFLKDIIKSYDITVVANLLCTHYKAVSSNSAGTWGCKQGMCVDGSSTVMVYDEAFNTSDISLWKAHLAEHPTKAVFELAEPTTEALPTADQIALNGLKSFDGVTYVETDSEVKPTIEVKCVLDTKAYIDRKFAELQAVLTAE